MSLVLICIRHNQIPSRVRFRSHQNLWGQNLWPELNPTFYRIGLLSFELMVFRFGSDHESKIMATRLTRCIGESDKFGRFKWPMNMISLHTLAFISIHKSIIYSLRTLGLFASVDLCVLYLPTTPSFNTTSHCFIRLTWFHTTIVCKWTFSMWIVSSSYTHALL